MCEVCGPYSLNEWQPQDILGRGPVAGKDLRDLAGGSQAPDRPSREVRVPVAVQQTPRPLTNWSATTPRRAAERHQWALVLAGCGRQADALAAIEATRSRLAEELGDDPGEHLREAQLRVLRQQILPEIGRAAPLETRPPPTTPLPRLSTTPHPPGQPPPRRQPPRCRAGRRYQGGGGGHGQPRPPPPTRDSAEAAEQSASAVEARARDTDQLSEIVAPWDGSYAAQETVFDLTVDAC